MIDLHITRQTYNFDCGAKALQTVMAYYGVDLREDRLIEELGSGEHGTHIEKIVQLAERMGFVVVVKEGLTIPKVKRYIDQGTPVMVTLQAWADRYMTIQDWREDWDDGHYAIIIGYKNNTILFEDPSSFRRTWLKMTEFMARWHDQEEDTGRRYRRLGIVLLGKDPASRNYVHMD
jgi:ABC-type bacteriocin/lantibiotic exporter with double-glycine peptidase domain